MSAIHLTTDLPLRFAWSGNYNFCDASCMTNRVAMRVATLSLLVAVVGTTSATTHERANSRDHAVGATIGDDSRSIEWAAVDVSV
jgi:hypothetical protein